MFSTHWDRGFESRSLRRASRWDETPSTESYRNVNSDSQFQKQILNRNGPDGLFSEKYTNDNNNNNNTTGDT
jgi:hypothetical protein